MVRSSTVEICINVIIVLSVTFSWALSSQIRKEVLTIDRIHFDSPFGLMWFGTNFVILCYPMYLLTVLFTKKSVWEAHNTACLVFPNNHGLSMYSMIVYVFPFLILWTLANYTFVLALLFISPSVTTCISSCSTAFVFILSLFILKEKFIIWKLFAVFFSFIGVFLISFDDNLFIRWEGILCAISTAIFAASYQVFFKKIVKEGSFGCVTLFISSIGLMNFVINIIPTLGLIFFEIETVHIEYIPWTLLLIASLLILVYNFMVNFGIAVTNPLIISIGMLLGVPLNAVIDVLFNSMSISFFFCIGSSMIILSVILIILPYDRLCNHSVVSDNQLQTSSMKVVVDSNIVTI